MPVNTNKPPKIKSIASIKHELGVALLEAHELNKLAIATINDYKAKMVARGGHLSQEYLNEFGQLIARIDMKAQNCEANIKNIEDAIKLMKLSGQPEFNSPYATSQFTVIDDLLGKTKIDMQSAKGIVDESKSLIESEYKKSLSAPNRQPVSVPLQQTQAHQQQQKNVPPPQRAVPVNNNQPIQPTNHHVAPKPNTSQKPTSNSNQSKVNPQLQDLLVNGPKIKEMDQYKKMNEIMKNKNGPAFKRLELLRTFQQNEKLRNKLRVLEANTSRRHTRKG